MSVYRIDLEFSVDESKLDDLGPRLQSKLWTVLADIPGIRDAYVGNVEELS